MLADATEMAGDTWHETKQAARDQAAWEYGERLGGWIDLADGTTDLTDVVAQLRPRDHCRTLTE